MDLLKRIVIPGGYGRTCNQLLQITHWIPTAIEKVIPLYFQGFRSYANYFCGTKSAVVPKFPHDAPAMPRFTGMLSRLLYLANRFHPAILGLCLKCVKFLPGNIVYDLPDSGCDGRTTPAMVLEKLHDAKGRTLWVKGWLYRDSQGVKKNETKIREFFEPNQPIARSINEFLRKMRRNNVILIGIHLRRGDYKSWNEGRYFYSIETYYRIMKSMSMVLQDQRLRFLIVSDEDIDPNSFPGFDLAVGLGDPMSDLYSLAACDYIIGPPSTFSIWAAWYGNVPLYHVKDPRAPLLLEHFKRVNL